MTELKLYDANQDFIWLLLRPWVWIPRILYITFRIILLILRFLIDGKSKSNYVQKELAKYLLDTITDLGPCFIKVGQSLSTRPDLVKQSWLDELIKLQDDLPKFDQNKALEIFEKEIGQSVFEIFEYFPSEPIASASLGQVYKAKLNKNYWVAVKIQRPNLRFIIRRDLAIIRFFSVLVAPILPLNLGFGLDEIIDEFGLSLMREIDYEMEAENAEKFANLFINDSTVIVPSVEKMISAKKVITTSWIEGTKISNRKELISNGINPTSIIRTAVISGIQQLLEFGYFHADPHPGNLFALEGKSGGKGKLGYVDFGMMDSLNDNDRITLTSAIVHLMNQDYDLLTKDFQKLGFLSSDQEIERIVPILKNVLGDVISKDVNTLNLKTITDRFSELMYDYPFRVPARFALIIRAVVSQEGLALKLDSNFKILRFAYPYIAKRLLIGQNEELVNILMEIIFDKNNRLRIDRLEGLLEVLTEGSIAPANELIPVAGNSLKLITSRKGNKIRKRLLLSLIKDDEFNTKEAKELLNLIMRQLNKNFVRSDLLAGINRIVINS